RREPVLDQGEEFRARLQGERIGEYAQGGERLVPGEPVVPGIDEGARGGGVLGTGGDADDERPVTDIVAEHDAVPKERGEGDEIVTGSQSRVRGESFSFVAAIAG